MIVLHQNFCQQKASGYGGTPFHLLQEEGGGNGQSPHCHRILLSADYNEKAQLASSLKSGLCYSLQKAIGFWGGGAFLLHVWTSSLSVQLTQSSQDCGQLNV